MVRIFIIIFEININGVRFKMSTIGWHQVNRFITSFDKIVKRVD